MGPNLCLNLFFEGHMLENCKRLICSPSLNKLYCIVLYCIVLYCIVLYPRPGVENKGAYKVEMVQRRAARWTLKRYHNTSSVTDMLENLGWRTLEQRRVAAQLALLFKIYNELIPVDARKYLRHPTQRFWHSHSYSFIPLSTSTSSHRLSFYPRTITQCNSLPQSFFENTNLTNLNSLFPHSITVL